MRSLLPNGIWWVCDTGKLLSYFLFFYLFLHSLSPLPFSTPLLSLSLFSYLSPSCIISLNLSLPPPLIHFLSLLPLPLPHIHLHPTLPLPSPLPNLTTQDDASLEFLTGDKTCFLWVLWLFHASILHCLLPAGRGHTQSRDCQPFYE